MSATWPIPRDDDVSSSPEQDQDKAERLSSSVPLEQEISSQGNTHVCDYVSPPHLLRNIPDHHQIILGRIEDINAEPLERTPFEIAQTRSIWALELQEEQCRRQTTRQAASDDSIRELSAGQRHAEEQRVTEAHEREWVEQELAQSRQRCAELEGRLQRMMELTNAQSPTASERGASSPSASYAHKLISPETSQTRPSYTPSTSQRPPQSPSETPQQRDYIDPTTLESVKHRRPRAITAARSSLLPHSSRASPGIPESTDA